MRGGQGGVKLWGRGGGTGGKKKKKSDTYFLLEKERKKQNEEDTVVKSPLSGVLFSLMKSNHFPHNITVTVFSVPPDSRRG